ncbi:hypothetical protein HY493_05710 [Candidatus Woesearchaeota archaeon]|nr:hypothetical protein [Candidatus Woesearchaeota archaeon]
MDLQTPLQEFGLTDKETAVYLALLPLDSVTVQELSKKLPYPRTTVYNTLTYLSEKGLVNKIVKRGITYFSAVAPDRLKDKLQEKQRLIESILPELSELKKQTRKSSTVELYEGLKGVYSILSDVFKIKQQTYYFGNYKKSLELLKHLPGHARTMRLERNIPAKIVIDPTDEDVFKTKKYKQFTEMRFLKSLESFPAMIFIYGTKVAMYTTQGDIVGVIIDNKEMSQAMKIVFELYWMQAKP